ncbi:MAG: thiamine diphosphokinase [Gaiellaceae bacterium MAG52_C11]|nr:thiamine diphosphokinase [Candidatus Gaiellasilicea maunaloa]
MVERAVIVAAGAPPLDRALPLDSEGAFVVAADGGADTALALGLRVDLAIGDFDSISTDGLAALERAGSRIERHAAAKDATDLELALDAALAAEPRSIFVVGSAGGRLDHLLSSLELLASSRYAGVELDAQLGGARVHVIHDSRLLEGEDGELLSLQALHGAAHGVITEGLLYRLAGETLEPGSSRGVSNVFAASEARVSLANGVLLAIRPGVVW